MGSLVIPGQGPIYLDVNAVVYSVEKHPKYSQLLRNFWSLAHAGRHDVISSALALLETLVGPLKSGDAQLRQDYERLFQRKHVRLVPITQPILREAARLRATVPGLRSPDAIHAATAIHAGATLVLTNDRSFTRVPGLPVTILDDVLSP